MSKVPSQLRHGARSFPCDLDAAPCGICGRTVVWCKNGLVGGGAQRLAVESCDVGTVGNVALQRSLIVDDPPIAFEVSNGTRFAWHTRCGSHVARAKVSR